MKRSVEELRSIFDTKISIIEDLLFLASKENLFSVRRKEFSALVAVELRSLFCNSGGDALIKNAQWNNDLIFPLHSRLTPFNELSDILLVSSSCNDKKCTFQTSIALDGTQVASTWLSYHSWINQIVVDLKMEGYPPLTRNDVIKLVADKNGAHVDPKIHKFLGLIETVNVMPFSITIDGRDCDVDCGNLLCETIFSIAMESIYSYKYLSKPPQMRPRKPQSGFMLRVYDYTTIDEQNNKEILRYKYTICTAQVNLYNTNRFYECKISSHSCKSYYLVFRNREFPVDLIKVEDCVLK